MSDGGRLLSTEGAIVPKKLPECSREYRRPWRLSRLELVKSALGGVSLPSLLGGKGVWRSQNSELRLLAYLPMPKKGGRAAPEIEEMFKDLFPRASQMLGKR